MNIAPPSTLCYQPSLCLYFIYTLCALCALGATSVTSVYHSNRYSNLMRTLP